MNGKKAKALRRQTADIPTMLHKVYYPVYEVWEDKLGRTRYKRIRVTPAWKRVNFYRQAKKRYAGSINGAVKQVINHATFQETTGKYKFA